MSATRTTTDSTVTRVSLVAEPSFRTRENGPHLSDLRKFVDACDGLPDEVVVRITTGHVGEGGRRDVTFELSFTHPGALQ